MNLSDLTPDARAYFHTLKPVDEHTTPYAMTIDVEGDVRVMFDPQEHQLEYMWAETLNVFLWGNRGGGKSFAARWHAHSLALRYPGFKYIIVRRSYPELHKTHLLSIKGELEIFGGSYNATDHIAHYPNGSKGFYNQCASDSDVKKVLGAEAGLVIFDEAPELEWDWMVLIAASVRVPVGSGYEPMVRYLGNPIGSSIIQLWSYFIDKDVDPEDDPNYNPTNYQAIEVHLKDNKYLPQDYHNKMMAGLPEHFRKAWQDGELTVGGALFSFQKKRDGNDWHVISELPVYGEENESILNQSWVRIYRAYDHGYSPDPAVCLWIAVVGKRSYVFKEKVWFKKTVKAIAKDIIEESKGLKVIETYCDPSINIKASQSDAVSILSKFEKFKVPMTPMVNDRELFADVVRQGLDDIEGGLPVVQILAGDGIRGGCPYLIKALPQQKWDENNPKKMADHKHDHPVVALAYYLMSNIVETGIRKKETKPRWMRAKKTETRKRVLGSYNVRRSR